MLLELGFVDIIGRAFEAADDDVADIVAFDDGFGFVPLIGFVEGLDVRLARAMRGPVAAPLIFVPDPAEDGGLSRVRGDTRGIGVTPADGFGDDSQRRRLEEADGVRVFGIVRVEVGGGVEGVSDGRVEVVGLVGKGEDGIDQPREEDESEQDAPGHVPDAAQVLQKDGCPEGGGDGPQLPGLIIELENGVDAVTKPVAEVDEVGGEDEEGGEED